LIGHFSSDHRDTGSRTIRSVVAALILLAALLTALVVFARSSSGAVHNVDVAVADKLNRYVAHQGGEVTAWKVVSDIGGPLTWRILAGIAVVLLWLRRRRRDALVVAVAMIGAAVLSGAVKALVHRHRPVVPIPVDHASGASFPSGHALTAFTALGLLVLLTWPHLASRWRALVVGAATLIVVAVGFSRLILGVHYLTDVLGGWVIGLLLLVGSVAARSPWAPRARPRRRRVSGLVRPDVDEEADDERDDDQNCAEYR
jgi:membrane-associated phospholipid phosphatase